jgi:hypothetical protein
VKTLQTNKTMKKLFILLALIPFFMGVVAQERTVTKIGSTNALTETKTLYTYTGVAADTLKPTTQDTIDFVLEYRGTKMIKKITVKSRFDVILGADTTVTVSVFGKEFLDDPTYVEIIAATASGVVAANNTVQVLSSDYTLSYGAYNSTVAAHNIPFANPTAATADTLKVPSHIIANAAQTVTPFDKTYRFYRVRYILTGNDSVGTGVKLDEIEFKIYTE